MSSYAGRTRGRESQSKNRSQNHHYALLLFREYRVPYICLVYFAWYFSDSILTFYFSDLLMFSEISLRFFFFFFCFFLLAVPPIALKSKINRTVRHNENKITFLSCTSIRPSPWRWNKLANCVRRETRSPNLYTFYSFVAASSSSSSLLRFHSIASCQQKKNAICINRININLENVEQRNDSQNSERMRDVRLFLLDWECAVSRAHMRSKKQTDEPHVPNNGDTKNI